MNDKRLRIPQVASLPTSGDDDSIRGQMRMSDVAGETTIMVCTTGDNQSVSTATILGVVYTSVASGDAGEDVSVEYVVGGIAAPAITVVDSAITVTATVAATGITISDAIEASAEASALVTVSAGDSTILAAVSQTYLSGGAGTKAEETYNTSLVVTAAASGRVGNTITVTIVEDAAAAYTTAAVARNTYDITITGTAAATTAEMAAAMNNNSNVSKLVSAVGSTETLVAAASAPLAGGISLSIWTSMAVA